MPLLCIFIAKPYFGDKICDECSLRMDRHQILSCQDESSSGDVPYTAYSVCDARILCCMFKRALRIILMYLKEVTFAHQGDTYLIKTTVKTVRL